MYELKMLLSVASAGLRALSDDPPEGPTVLAPRWSQDTGEVGVEENKGNGQGRERSRRDTRGGTPGHLRQGAWGKKKKHHNLHHSVDVVYVLVSREQECYLPGWDVGFMPAKDSLLR